MPLSVNKQKIEDVRCLAMDARACVERRGEPDSSFRLVAMAPPEAMRRNGGLFCARRWQAFDGVSGGGHGSRRPPSLVLGEGDLRAPKHGTMIRRETLIKSLSSSV